jgi:hypothetical protein
MFIDQSLTTLGHIKQNGLVNPSTLSVYSTNGVEAPDFENTDIPFNLPIASHYAAIKVRLRNQYGQLPSVKQIVITPCEQKINPAALLPYGPYSLEGWRSAIIAAHPHFDLVGGVSSHVLKEPVQKGTSFALDKFSETVSNFYMTDPISRASKTMAECTKVMMETRGKVA